MSEKKDLKFKTLFDMRWAAKQGEIQKGDVAHCEEVQGNYLYEGDMSFVCVKTDQDGYKYLYGHEVEQ